MEVVQVAELILILLIPAAYYAGRYTQWRTDFKRSRGMRRREW